MANTYNIEDVWFYVYQGKAYASSMKDGAALPKGSRIKFTTAIDWDKYMELSKRIHECPVEKRDSFYNACFALSCDVFLWGFHLVEKRIIVEWLRDIELVAKVVVEVTEVEPDVLSET